MRLVLAPSGPILQNNRTSEQALRARSVLAAVNVMTSAPLWSDRLRTYSDKTTAKAPSDQPPHSLPWRPDRIIVSGCRWFRSIKSFDEHGVRPRPPGMPEDERRFHMSGDTRGSCQDINEANAWVLSWASVFSKAPPTDPIARGL